MVVFGFNGESYRGGEPTWDCCMDVKGKEEKMICRAMGLDPFKLFGVLSVNGKESLSISHAISEHNYTFLQFYVPFLSLFFHLIRLFTHLHLSPSFILFIYKTIVEQ